MDPSLNLPFPATTKQVAGMVKGVKTDVMAMDFSDKIMIMISQEGRLAHWVSHFADWSFRISNVITNLDKLHVPLENQNPGTDGMHTFPEGTDDSLLPLAGLTATSLVGGYAPGLDTFGQLLARQIATCIAMKSPSEKRLLVVGLGLRTSLASDQETFTDLLDLVLRC